MPFFALPPAGTLRATAATPLNPIVPTAVTNGGISIPLGIFIGLLASFVQSLGLAIQRRSHVLNSQLPEPERKVEHRRPLWLLGFAIFLSSNIFGSFIQIASLPVVILAPLGAVSLLWNALFARLLLRPPLILGTALIAGGAALIAVYGIVPETPRSVDELMALFARPAFIAWFCVESVILIVCLVATHIAEYTFTRRLASASESLLYANSESCTSSLSESPDHSPHGTSTLLPPTQQPSNLTTGLTEEIVTTSLLSERTPLLDPKAARPPSTKSSLHKSRSSSPSASSKLATNPASSHHSSVPGRTPLLLALAYAAASGTLSGLCLIFAKSGVELLLLTLGGSNQFYRWEAWALVGGLVAFALGQLWYLNRGLRLADPAFVCPSAFCFYNFSSILNGLVYFHQLAQLPGWHIVLVVVGMLVLLAGVWAVSAQAGVDGTWAGEDNGTEEDVEVVEPDDHVNADGATFTDVETQPPLPSYATTFPTSPSKPRSRHVAPPMDRQARSEGALRPEGSLSLHTLHPPSPDLSTRHPRHLSLRSPPLEPDEALLSPTTTTRSSRRRLGRRATVVDPSASIRTLGSGSSVHQQQPSVLSPPLGTGLMIGLSPMSPGFSLVPPERRNSRRASGVGHGFADVVVEGMHARHYGGGQEEGDGERRRTVSEGNVRRWREAGGDADEHGELRWDDANSPGIPNNEDEETRGRHHTGRRWGWVRRVFLGKNPRGPQ
ncbi:hypothetical protein BV22DRAFT_1190732 [Leucogyrophana mollusca]|uniref:Uncharacterized protein n=1 Tax=Leucogyrophana mollusca TaxID=85980 RepID=A0ACB8C1H3_9AGAM|nr:hypothetical protein BV22DRAFT_1190732 [Leucogyrophana mollusca]